MPVLESKLIIGAKDETGGAFAKIQKHIASLAKQIATFDKLSAAAGKVAGANDPMIAAIDRGAKSLAEEKVALEALQRAMSLGVGSAEEMAAVQGRLARETSAATRAMAAQGAEAAHTSRKIKSARESVPKGGGFGGMTLGLMGSIFLIGIGAVSSVSFSLLSMVFLVAAPTTTITKASSTLIATAVIVDVLLWAPSFRTPKCANCMLFGWPGSSLVSGFAIFVTVLESAVLK